MLEALVEALILIKFRAQPPPSLRLERHLTSSRPRRTR